MDYRPLPGPAPIETPNIIGQLAQVMGIKGAQQDQAQRAAMAPLQQQEAQQAVQTGAVDLQMKQQQLKDQQIMGAALLELHKPPQSAPASTTPPANAPSGAAPGDPNTPTPLAASQAASPSGGQADPNAAAPQTAPATPAPARGALDYDRLYDLAQQGGMSFNGLQALQARSLDIKTKNATIAVNDARAGTSNVDTMIKKNSMITDAMLGVLNTPDVQLPLAISQTAQELAAKGLFDPQHMQMAQQAEQLARGNPAAAKQQLQIYANSIGAYSKSLEDAQKQVTLDQEKGKSDPNSPFYAPSAASVAMGTAPGAKQIVAGEAKEAGAKAGAEAAARAPFELRLATQRQALSQGDPTAAAQLLVNGDATLAELKARGSTPEFIASTLAAAHKLSGGQYNAQQADAAFDVAKSPANVGFFGSAKSLTDKGGTLDQLAQAGASIPQGQLPALNSIADWEKAATGSGPVAKYASLALGVADDYSKVMGGGQGSDTSRTQALNLVGAKMSPEQRAASIEGIRGAVSSQMESRIGKNPVLQRMYGAILPTQAGQGVGAASNAGPTPNTHAFSLSAWQAAHPGGDANAAKVAAQQGGYEVMQ